MQEEYLGAKAQAERIQDFTCMTNKMNQRTNNKGNIISRSKSFLADYNNPLQIINF